MIIIIITIYDYPTINPSHPLPRRSEHHQREGGQRDLPDVDRVHSRRERHLRQLPSLQQARVEVLPLRRHPGAVLRRSAEGVEAAARKGPRRRQRGRRRHHATSDL